MVVGWHCHWVLSSRWIRSFMVPSFAFMMVLHLLQCHSFCSFRASRWNSVWLSCVHLRCVHFSHVVHSMALWFDLHGALHVVHGYFWAVYFFLVGRSMWTSILS